MTQLAQKVTSGSGYICSLAKNRRNLTKLHPCFSGSPEKISMIQFRSLNIFTVDNLDILFVLICKVIHVQRALGDFPGKGFPVKLKNEGRRIKAKSKIPEMLKKSVYNHRIKISTTQNSCGSLCTRDVCVCEIATCRQSPLQLF